jgi:hypothetical protein
MAVVRLTSCNTEVTTEKRPSDHGSPNVRCRDSCWCLDLDGRRTVLLVEEVTNCVELAYLQRLLDCLSCVRCKWQYSMETKAVELLLRHGGDHRNLQVTPPPMHTSIGMLYRQ